MIKIARVKSAAAKDLRDINRLLPQLSDNAKPMTAVEYRKLLSSKANLLFAARDGGRVVGMATMVAVHTPTGRRAWLEDVVVDAGYRGQGIGERLCMELVSAAKRMKLDQMTLTTRPTRVAANKLYQRLGFEQKETNVYRMKFKKAKRGA